MSKSAVIARSLIYIVFLFTAAGLLVAVFGEMAIRLLQPQHDSPQWFERGGPYTFQLKRDFQQEYKFGATGVVMEVRTNTLGLRDKPRDYSAPFEGKTVVLAGDSFVFGHGINVPERLDTVLTGLIDPGEKKVRILNAGVPGWGTIQATRFVRDHFDLLRPDAVVLVFCGNDPDDDTQFLNHTGMYAGNTKFFGFPGKDFLRIHSHLYRFLLFRATILRHDLDMRARQRRGEKVLLDTQTAEPISPADWERTLEVIRQFQRDLVAHNPEAILLVAASNPQDANIREHLASLDNGKDLRFIDLEPCCAHLSPDQMHLSFDQHWSPLVHAAAAQGIYEALTSSGFLATP